MTRRVTVRHWLGVPEHTTTWHDKLVATGVSTVGIAIVIAVSQASKSLSFAAPLWLVGSIGATAVLVFAVPHGPLSQPWSVLGGHGVSAIVGITVAHLAGGGSIPAALAVGGAIGAMSALRCVHPPGGATALAAVMMATPAHAPSWQYPFTPVLLNAATIVLAATVLNAPFAWRRYPLALAFRPHHNPPPSPPPFTADQLETALREIDVVATMSDEDFLMVYRSIRRQQGHEHEDELERELERELETQPAAMEPPG